MRAAAPAHVCALIPVGPGDAEISRTQDLLESITACEPLVTSVVLVDDAMSPRQLGRRLGRARGPRIHDLLHPRRGRGPGVWGGLTEGVFTALHYIHARLHEPIILRLDTDSLVIGPFAERLTERFNASMTVGVLGTVDRNCDGTERSFSPWDLITRRVRKRFAKCTGDEIGNLPFDYFQTQIGPARRVRHRAREAFDRGYRAGEHAQGGGYAIHRKVLLALALAKRLDEGRGFRQFFFSEDVAVGLYTRLAGFELANFNAPGEVFGVTYRGLPFPPEQMIELGYSVIHSLKHGSVDEDELRQFFRHRRSDLGEGFSTARNLAGGA